MKDARGQSFIPVEVFGDGVLCADCKRVIRVREKAAQYGHPAASGFHLRCRDCMYGEPLNEHNREWRKDAAQKGRSA